MATPLSESRLQLAEYYFSDYAVVLPAGVSLDDALKPEFWAHVTKRFRQYDMIRLVPEDGSFFAEVLVVIAAPNFVKLKLLRDVPLTDDAEAPAANDLAYAEWGGPHDKWRVIRDSDKQVLHKQLPDKLAAQKAAAAYTAIAA
jgi:hypothetical protein